MDDISAIGGAEDIRKGSRNCREIKLQKKMEYGQAKTKILAIKTGSKTTEKIHEKVRAGKVEETEKVKYLGMVINSDGNLEDHIKQMTDNTNNICREINAIGSKSQVGTEELKVKIKLCETCLMPAIMYGLEVWGRITSSEMKEITKIQIRALKQILNLPKSTPSTGILFETGIWPVKERVEYSTMMGYHSIVKSDDNRIAKKIIEEKQKEQFKNTMYERVKYIAKELNINITKVETIKKSTWKRLVKEKITKKVEERLKSEMKDKTKARTVREGKWEMKEYIKNCNGEDARDILLDYTCGKLG